MSRMGTPRSHITVSVKLETYELLRTLVERLSPPSPLRPYSLADVVALAAVKLDQTTKGAKRS